MDNDHKFELIKNEFSFRKGSVLAVMFLLVYFGGILLLLNQPEYCETFSYVMISVLYILVAFSLLAATKHAKVQGKRTQIAWGILTLSVLFSAVGSILWAVIVLYYNQNPSTSIADIFYLLFFPLFLLGILVFPSSRITNRQRFKAYFDIGMVIWAITLVVWTFFIAPAIENYSGDMLSLSFRLTYIISGFFLLFALLDLIFNRIKKEFQAPFLILAVSILILVITDSIYAYQNLSGNYVVGSITDYGWMIGYLIMGLAGVAQITNQKTDLQFLSKHIPWHADYHWTPYIALAGVFTTYICLLYAINTNDSHIMVLELGVGVLIVLVISRQIVSITENKNLYRKAQEEISSRKKIYKSLEKSESAYRTIFENTGTATIIIDENNMISMVNTEFEELSGYSKEELLGKKSWTDFIFDEDLEKAQQYFSLGSDQYSSTNNHDFRFRDKSGKIKNVFLIFTNIPSSKTILATLLDVSDRTKAENELKASLEEKEMLLKEIHHRVKNNLMVISSLLSLQSMYIKDKEQLEMFKESQSRAKSMALIHERLYQSDDLKRIDFGEYIQKLALDSFHTYVSDPGAINLNLNVETVMLDINTAIPLGLILNELLSNSMKYAFPNGKKGEITVNFFKKDDNYTLIVEDNGRGFPEDIDFKNTDSLGLQLINSLTGQISGEISLDRSKGTSFKISFKEEDY